MLRNFIYFVSSDRKVQEKADVMRFRELAGILLEVTATGKEPFELRVLILVQRWYAVVMLSN